MNNDIFEAIQQERQYQIQRFGRVRHEIPGWVLIIKKQLDTAVMHWLDGEPSKALAEIVQSTAVGVACLEQHGVPKEAFREVIGAKLVEEHEKHVQKLVEEVEAMDLEETKVEETPERIVEKVSIVGFENRYTYQLGQGYIAIRISELENAKEQDALKKFMHGQTQPMIVGYPPGDFVYLHDYENFRADGTLFWD